MSAPLRKYILNARGNGRFLWLLFGLGGIELGEQVRPLAHLVSEGMDVYTFWNMTEHRIKTAILGLDDGGQGLLEAARQVDFFQIQAVADKDAKLAERVAAEYGCAAYDDYRQLVIEMGSGLGGKDRGCLLVAAGMYSCDEHIRAAMKKGLNILKLAPAARNFEEAAEFVRLAEDEQIRFAIANPLRFAQSFIAFDQFLEQGRIEKIFLNSAFCGVSDEDVGHWQCDPKLAGGGVVLRNCYDIVDQMVCNFIIPQQVYCLTSNAAGDRQQRHYLTEDTAVVTMKFADTFFGNLVASKVFGPKQKYLKVYGKDKILQVSETKLVVSDGLGKTIEQFEYDDDRPACMKKVLKNFALSIEKPAENKLCSSGRENLPNMAVIESAYLSARTGMPEEPGRILQMAQIEPLAVGEGTK